MTNTTTTPVTYDDRRTEALDYLAERYVERGNFLSDSDLMDAAERYSIDWNPEADIDTPRPDYDRLVGDLYETLTPPPEASEWRAAHTGQLDTITATLTEVLDATRGVLATSLVWKLEQIEAHVAELQRQSIATPDITHVEAS